MVPLRIGKNLNQGVGEEKGVKRQVAGVYF